MARRLVSCHDSPSAPIDKLFRDTPSPSAWTTYHGSRIKVLFLQGAAGLNHPEDLCHGRKEGGGWDEASTCG